MPSISNDLWTSFNIFMVLSLTNELNKIFDLSSSYICLRLIILLFKKLYLNTGDEIKKKKKKK